LAERQAHVLVVDDDESLIDLYRDVLGDEGYRITALTDAPGDPAIVRALAPDVLLLDLRLGNGLDGPSLLDRLATDPATAAIPVVLCTGDVREVEALRRRDGGLAAAVVFKPFDLDHLLAVVATAAQPEPVA
jgi:CheY-like chemotaxis protein